MRGDVIDRFADYERSVRAYASSWFKSDAAAQDVISRIPSVRAGVIRLAAAGRVVGTDCVYQLGRRWLPNRMLVHDALISKLLGPTNSPAAGDIIPMAIMMVGLPGSGKTSLLRPVAVELIQRTYPAINFTVDADSVRVELPEYAGGLGSEVVQNETAFVTYDQLIDQAYRRSCHLIFDLVGDPKYILDDVTYLISAGWAVACLGADVDVEVAVERVMERALSSGRYVPPAYVRSVGSRPRDAYRVLRNSSLPLVGCALFDTSGDPTRPPRVIDTNAPELFGEEDGPTTLWSSVGGAV